MSVKLMVPVQSSMHGMYLFPNEIVTQETTNFTKSYIPLSQVVLHSWHESNTQFLQPSLVELSVTTNKGWSTIFIKNFRHYTIPSLCHISGNVIQGGQTQVMNMQMQRPVPGFSVPEFSVPNLPSHSYIAHPISLIILIGHTP